MMRKLSLPLLAILLLPSSCLSFTATTHRQSSTSLNLVPSQGKELEAFVNNQGVQGSINIDARIHHKEQDSTDTTPAITPLTAARSFISRIFHQDDDNLVYPIVGFRWVGNKVVPTTTTAACALHREDRFEELVGWFSPTSHDVGDDDEKN
mmetsp:Transcript_19897/g.26298  ORF Transcript_19897/g.26298 Transcript_19897/m.26298 type:complete len:151 (-) Transcript_19897:302-754(-)